MTILVVVESRFGNTRRVAEAIAGALDATLVWADEATATLPPDVDLVIAGAPTHAMGLPSPRTRAMTRDRDTSGARAQREEGGSPHSDPEVDGLAEWIDRVSLTPPIRVVTFDTSVRGGTLFGRAARSAAKRLSSAGVSVQRGESFLVTSQDELTDGELERAAVWARGLVS